MLAIHRRDIAAGADAILTNTFGANRFWLEKFGRRRCCRVDQSPCRRLAREAAGTGRFVIGDIGPAAALERGAPRSSRRRSWSTPAPMP